MHEATVHPVVSLLVHGSKLNTVSKVKTQSVRAVSHLQGDRGAPGPRGPPVSYYRFMDYNTMYQ